MDIEILLVFLLSTSLLTISPGPDILYVFYKSISDGKNPAIKTVFGLTTGLFFHTFLLVIGFSILIKNNQTIFFLIKIFGFLYFLFLALNILFKNKKPNSNKLRKSNNDFFVGLMMNLLNPKVSLFFIAFFPGFIFSDSIIIEIQFLVLGVIFWFVATSIFLVVVFISSTFKNQIQDLLDNKNLKYVQALVFLLVGIWIIK